MQMQLSTKICHKRNQINRYVGLELTTSGSLPDYANQLLYHHNCIPVRNDSPNRSQLLAHHQHSTHFEGFSQIRVFQQSHYGKRVQVAVLKCSGYG